MQLCQCTYLKSFNQKCAGNQKLFLAIKSSKTASEADENRKMNSNNDGDEEAKKWLWL